MKQKINNLGITYDEWVRLGLNPGSFDIHIVTVQLKHFASDIHNIYCRRSKNGFVYFLGQFDDIENAKMAMVYLVLYGAIATEYADKMEY